MKTTDEWAKEMKWGHIEGTIEAIREEMREACVKAYKLVIYHSMGKPCIGMGKHKKIVLAIRNAGKE